MKSCSVISGRRSSTSMLRLCYHALVMLRLKYVKSPEKNAQDIGKEM
jgi:hypothetical protein